MCAAAGGAELAPAKAAAHVAEAASSAEASTGAIEFGIPKGPLGDVLRSYEAATGLHVEPARPDLLTLESPGVSGRHTAQAALRRLLTGTGLAARFVTGTQAVVELAAVAASVEVSDTISYLSTSSPKFNAPLLDTPQTITAIPREVLEQQGNMSLRDALRNVSGISIAAGEGGAQGDNLTIRGFTARNDLFIDGMRDFGSYYRDPFNTEEVEVLQGPSSVTFGRGSTGGVVNQATKSPRADRLLAINAEFGTDQTRRGTADWSTPFRAWGDTAYLRLNAMGMEGRPAGRDVAEIRRYGFAPSLAFGLGTSTRATFSYLHEGADDTPDYGVPWLFNAPAPVNRRNYYGFEDGNFLRTSADIGTARLEHDLNGRFTLRNQFRVSSYSRDVRITEGRIAGTPTLSTPLSALNVARNQIAVNSAEQSVDEQLDLSGSFRTGALLHSVTGGVEASRETSSPTRLAWANVPGTSLLNPNPYQAFQGTSSVSSRVRTTAVGAAAYVLDTVHLTRNLELSAGLRWDRFGADYANYAGAIASFRRVDRMTSWRSALVYKPLPFGTFYVAAGTSFNPSAESLSLSASTANLPPEANRSYEAGTKWDLRQGRLSLRGALFRTDKLNAREPDPVNAALNVLAGRQRAQGVTVEMNGQLTRQWNMLAGYTHLDAKLASSNYYPAAVGAQLANVPANTFNFWTNYRLPRRWQIGAGGNYVAGRTASSTAPLDPATGLVKEVPGYWVFNAMVQHQLAEHLDLQANVYNVANRYYFDQVHPGHLVPGPGRSALLGVKFHF
jgi:catecholate siderophore receptor